MATPNVHQRLHAVMQECDYLQKESKAGMRYKIVSHDKVTAYVRPVLVKHGIVYYPVGLSRSQNGNRTEIDLTVRFANIDDPADHIDVVASGYGVDDQDKGPGKAISYAVKYCLLKALGLETGDDPDTVQDDSATHRPAPNGNGEKMKALADVIKDEIDAAGKLAELNTSMTRRGEDYTSSEPKPDSDLAKVRAFSETAYRFLIDRANKRRSALANQPQKQVA